MFKPWVGWSPASNPAPSWRMSSLPAENSWILNVKLQTVGHPCCWEIFFGHHRTGDCSHSVPQSFGVVSSKALSNKPSVPLFLAAPSILLNSFCTVKRSLYSVSVLKCNFVAINIIFNLLTCVSFVVRKLVISILGYEIVHAQFNAVSNSLSSSIHIRLMKNIPLSREKTPSQGLAAIFSPNLQQSWLVLLLFESSHVAGDEMQHFLVWVGPADEATVR